MDKFAALKAYVTVVEHEGFAAAARAMGQSRSAVNHLIISLENDLGVQLLNRTTRQVAPNPDGLAFYERAKSILGDLERAEKSLKDTSHRISGQLRISAPMSFGTMHLGKAISLFMTKNPDLNIELQLNDRFVNIIEEGYDLAIRLCVPQEDTTLVDFRMCETKRVIAASPQYLKTHGTPQLLNDLRHYKCLHYGNLPSGNRWQVIDTNGKPTSVFIKSSLCANNGEVLRDAAVNHLGIVNLPTFIIGQELQAGRLVTLLEHYELPPLTLSAIYPPTRHLSARIRLFTDFLMEYFGKRPYWDLVE